MLSSERLTDTESKPILCAITSIHSRVRAAVFPARSIEAPNHNRTSTASLGAGAVDLSSLLRVDGTRHRTRPHQRAEGARPTRRADLNPALVSKMEL
jgi:hypothetical protein